MSPALLKFRGLLAELFQTDHRDLDFGIYRVLNVERRHIDRFLNDDLENLVKVALGAADDSQRAGLELELAELAAGAKELGVEPTQSPKWKAKRAELDGLGAADDLESDVYNALFEFFSRFYSNGDFSRQLDFRRDGFTSIPYRGQEVHLHWANADQYYIKSARVLDAFTFTVEGKTVHFRVAPTEPGQGENNKELRSFVLEMDENDLPKIEANGGHVTAWFGFKKRATGDVAASEAAPLLASAPEFAGIGEAVLQAKLRNWSRRRDFDFFVHRDLRGFLGRELDGFLKQEVVQLGALLRGDEAQWRQTTLAKARAIQSLGIHLIEFLSQLEELQKRLWLKQKWVTQSALVLPLGQIPPALREDVTQNADQLKEWRELVGFEPGGAAAAGQMDFGEVFPPTLSVDTRHFSKAWERTLLTELSKVENLESLWNGIAFNADNFAALQLMQNRFAGDVKCVYIDPPYNANSSEIIYKNSYKHSSWLAMMANRLEVTTPLLSADGCMVIAIDENEQARLDLLIEDSMVGYNRTCISVVHNPAGVQGSNFSYTHESAIFIFPENGVFIGNTARGEDLVSPLRDWGGTSARRLAKNCFYPIIVEDGEIVGFGEVCAEDFHPGAANITTEGRVYVYPVDKEGEEKKWVFGRNSVEKNQDQLFIKEQDGQVVVMRRKTDRKNRTVWDDKKYYANIYGSKLLSNMFGKQPFSFPKSIHTVEDSIQAINSVKKDSLILDYFAGSGTTGHATINLNRADGAAGQRRFVLCEMGRYFDSVLVPRLKKAAYAEKWKDGRPAEGAPRGGVGLSLWCYRLESYEDALEHLAAAIESAPQLPLDAPDAAFTVRYALRLDAGEGEVTLSDGLFRSPFGMQMRVGGDEAGHSEAVPLDAVATFNWMLGLRVEKGWFVGADLAAPELACVCGLAPDGSAVVVVWRQLEGVGFESADALLLEFWQGDEILRDWRATHEVATVWVNGDSTRWRMATAGENFRCEPLETRFREEMFAPARTGEAI